MTTRLEQEAREYALSDVKAKVFNKCPHQNGFINGWKACREQLAEKFLDVYYNGASLKISTFGDERASIPDDVKKKYATVEISKEAIEAAKNGSDFVKLAKSLPPLDMGFRTYEYKGQRIVVSDNPEMEVARLKAMGIDAINLDSYLRDAEHQRWEKEGQGVML